jgi:hypothetical protein
MLKRLSRLFRTRETPAIKAARARCAARPTTTPDLEVTQPLLPLYPVVEEDEMAWVKESLAADFRKALSDIGEALHAEGQPAEAKLALLAHISARKATQ